MWKNLLSLSALILSSAVLFQSFNFAQATGIGPMVSRGTNPIFSTGGSIPYGQSSTILSATNNEDMLITDLSLDVYHNTFNCVPSLQASFYLSNGTALAEYEVIGAYIYYNHSGNPGSPGRSIRQHFQSGIKIPAGESLIIQVTRTTSGGYGSCGQYGLRYTLSGHHTQP